MQRLLCVHGGEEEQMKPEQKTEHEHDYLPIRYWQLDYQWLAVLFQCQQDSECKNRERIESYKEERMGDS